MPRWLVLHRKSACSTPFNHPMWVLSWWRERQDRDLNWSCVAGFTEDRRLVGLLPLVRFPNRIVRFAGHDLCDIGAALVEDDRRTELWQKAIEHLAQLGTTSVLDLPVLADQDLAVLYTLGFGDRLQVYDTDPGARIDLPSNWNDYWRSLPNRRQRRMSAERRGLERAHGPIRLELVERDQALLCAADSFWALREASWLARGRYLDLPDHARGTAMRTFLAALSRSSAGSGFAVVARLTAGDRIIGSAFLLASGRRMWYSMCAFATEFAKYGPGRHLLAECVRAAIADRLTGLELGRGVEPYKFALGATRYELSSLRLRLDR